MPILVTGARGNVGAHVVQGLLRAGETVRAASRTLRRGEADPAVDVAQIDLTEPDSVRPALAGVTKVFLYTEAGGAEALVDLLRTSGVEQIVLLSSASVLFPDAAENPVAQQHRHLEELIAGTGVRWTAIRPAYFAANALRWTTIRTERVLRTAFPDGETPMVHEKDIADLAVTALTVDGFDGRALTALGAGTSSVRDQVALISSAIHEDVRIERLAVEQYRHQLGGRIPAAMVDRLIRAAGSAPLPDPRVATDDVESVLHRPPLTFEQWANDHANDFR